MPQETKSHPFNADSESVGTLHENLEGWVPSLASDDEIRAAFEKAFDYRGDITLTLKDGNKVEGYIFDRRSAGNTLSDCVVRLFPKNEDHKISIRYSDVARVEFTGKDTAAGKSFETWVKKYQQKKAAGETNIGLEPEKLD
jgi:tRNA splicing ligase